MTHLSFLFFKKSIDDQPYFMTSFSKCLYMILPHLKKVSLVLPQVFTKRSETRIMGSSSKFPCIIAHSIFSGAFFPHLGLLFLFLFQQSGLRKTKFFQVKKLIFEALSNSCSKQPGYPSSKQKQYHRQGLQNEHTKTCKFNMNDLQKDHE